MIRKPYDKWTHEDVRNEARKHFETLASFRNDPKEASRYQAEYELAPLVVEAILALQAGELFDFPALLKAQGGGKERYAALMGIAPYFWGSLRLLDLEFGVPRLGEPDVVGVEEIAPLWRKETQSVVLRGEVVTTDDVVVRLRRTATANQPYQRPVRQHVFHDREDGLQHCKVCNGAEGSLPSECPGVRMPPETEEAVYACILDYAGGQWVAGQAQRADLTAG